MRRYAALNARLTWLLALVLGCWLTSCGRAQSGDHLNAHGGLTRGQGSSTSGSTPERPKPSPTTAGQGPLRRCQPVQVRLAVARGGSNMSHPFYDISITNTGARTCALRGYPRVAVAGRRELSDQPAPAVPVAIRTNHWIYERVDPGPHQVLVPPRHQVFFSIGSEDAYAGPLFTLTRLTVILPGTRSPEMLAVSLPASGPPGQKIPLGHHRD